MRFILLGAIMASLVTATGSMYSLIELFQAWGTASQDSDFWYYLVLGLQEDDDTTSDCMSSYDDLSALALDVQTKCADKTDYEAGFATKGNGQSTNFGFAMYKVLKWTDVLILGVDLWEGCSIKDYMLSVGKGVTSVNGAIQLAISFMYRFFASDDEAANYQDLSDAVTN